MGGYWSLVISAIPFTLITIYLLGQRRLMSSLRPMTIDCFVPRYEEFYKTAVKIPGTAIFFVKSSKAIPQYMRRIIFENNILYKDNVIVSILQKDEPYGIHYGFKDPLASGLRHFEIAFGYMEILDISSILEKADLGEKAIFYGVEEVSTQNPLWKVYAVMKRLTPSSVRFYKLPAEQLHGVMVRVNIDRHEKAAATCEQDQ
jgi:KUP system potassium uptake protein